MLRAILYLACLTILTIPVTAQQAQSEDIVMLSSARSFSKALSNVSDSITENSASIGFQQSERGLAWALDKHLGRGIPIRVVLTTGDTLQGDYIRHIQRRVMFYMGRPQMSIPFEEVVSASTLKNRTVFGVMTGFTIGTTIAYILNDGISENFYQSDSELKDGIMLFAVNSVMGGVPLGMLGGFIGKYLRRWEQVYPVK